MGTCLECHVRQVCRLMMKVKPGLCADFLVFVLLLRKTPEKLSCEGCATSHPLKWGPLPLNEVGKKAQLVKEGEGRRRQGLMGKVYMSTLLCLYRALEKIFL